MARFQQQYREQISKDLATFDEIDARYLKEICSWLV